MPAAKAVRLLPIDGALVETVAAGADRFEARYGARLGDAAETVREAAARTVAFLGASSPGPWRGYLAVDDATGQVIGTCAFKGPPRGDPSEVEIAYFTFPPHEGLGYATAMAAGLIERARAAAPELTVMAHTLPEQNASGRVLAKVGMQFSGEVVDPEDGRVWRWQLPGAG